MSLEPYEQNPALFDLRLRWVGYLLACAVLWVLGYRFVQSWWEPAYAARWMILSGLALAYLLWSLWRGLEHNAHSAEGSLVANFGFATVITIWRGVLVAALAGFLISPCPSGWQAWLPGALLILITLIGWANAFIVQRGTNPTLLGTMLETRLNELSFLIAVVLVVQYGQAPWWYLIIGLYPFLLQAIAWLRRRQGKPLYRLPTSRLSRLLAGVQQTFLCAILLPIFSPPATTVAAILFAMIALHGFASDCLIVSGKIHPERNNL
ncbi:MAG: hypothetical protein JW726_04025 [Anaerolineales bacterium]|nr:hypothetical protein [Anaerolineales bacterium]